MYYGNVNVLHKILDSNIQFLSGNLNSMTHDLKVAASFSHQNIVVHNSSYPYTKFHTDFTTPSSKTTLNLNINLVWTDKWTDGRTDRRTICPACLAGGA